MSNETPTLPASTRERTGTRYARRLRASGQLPAVIYGQGMDPLSISVNEKEIIRHLTNGAHVFELDIDGGRKETCLVKDLQFGWLGDNVVHLDLTKVDLDEEVTVNVRLIFKGSPKAASAAGAILKQNLAELEIGCKVRDIPEEIVVLMDEMGESLTIGDLELPDGVTPTAAADTVVCQIIVKAKGSDAAADGEDGGEDGGETQEGSDG